MHESLCINRGFVYIQMYVATSYCTETRLTNVPIFSAKDNLYTLQVAALAPLALPEARYAHLVIAHLMVILWRIVHVPTRHICMMAKLVMTSATGMTRHCNGNSGTHVQDGRQLDCAGCVPVDNSIQLWRPVVESSWHEHSSSL